MPRSASELRTMAREALAAKASQDPRYELLVMKLALKTGLSRQDVESGIVSLAK